MDFTAVSRVQREFRDFISSNEASRCGMKMELVNDNYLELRAEIIGPPDTPYEGGTFKLEVSVPDAYPYRPPRVRFVTLVWHPNVSSVTGAICLDILKDQWAAGMTLRTVLLSIQALLASPEPQDPQDAVVAREYLFNRALFDATARFWTHKWAGGPVAEDPRPMATGDETTTQGSQPRGASLAESATDNSVDDTASSSDGSSGDIGGEENMDVTVNAPVQSRQSGESTGSESVHSSSSAASSDGRLDVEIGTSSDEAINEAWESINSKSSSCETSMDSFLVDAGQDQTDGVTQNIQSQPPAAMEEDETTDSEGGNAPQPMNVTSSDEDESMNAGATGGAGLVNAEVRVRAGGSRTLDAQMQSVAVDANGNNNGSAAGDDGLQDSMDEAKPFQCDICGRSFETKRGLAQHGRRTHDIRKSVDDAGPKRSGGRGRGRGRGKARGRR